MIVELEHRLFLAQDYAIINPMQVSSDQYGDLDAQRMIPKGLERHHRMMPLLVRLASVNEPRRLELLERTNQWARRHHMPLFSALFSSSRPPDRVMPNLLANMLLRRAGRHVWLRYHDPRVFRHLQWLFDHDQVAALMGPAQTWLGFDPLCRRWHQWSCPVVQRHPRLRLDAKQWEAVEQFEALNGCLRDLSAAGEATDDDTARGLLEGLLEAGRQGLVQDVDVMLYARQHLARGLERTAPGGINRAARPL
ncbi:DUF4123 domain-containing protein [Luteimonas terrae]|uniref:DUF4123 domain-containing protein n=1 Tax=Luteimonas terrae TaxID=1530191 RepID=A0ABU1XV86_9GAMM|nr:DUF4123 domain-containing protein [Luteimonas terrae]MDR7192655.1 hypothetical protein [Luteimonas terrae]